MGGVVVCSRSEGVSRMSRVWGVFKAEIAVETIESMDARLGDCNVWCADGVEALCNPGDAGGCAPATREGTGLRVEGRAGASLVKDAAGGA